MYQNKHNSPFKRDISLLEFFIYILKKWYILFAIVLTAFIAVTVYIKVMQTPIYASVARMYVVNKDSESITASDMSLSHYLSKDYAEIILDTPILSKVHNKLNGEVSIAQIKSSTTIKSIENTRILEIRAITPDPQISKKIVDSICEISQEELIEIMGLDRIKIIKEGTLSSVPANSNHTNIISTVLLASTFFALFIIYLIYTLDNNLSSKEDVEKYLELNILATIPYNPNKQHKK